MNLEREGVENKTSYSYGLTVKHHDLREMIFAVFFFFFFFKFYIL